ncbi:MAG: alkaline phosphatase [Planctomycetes bacterium]|nr:alkaline phosphatase [Planctomycetota bacterium]
MKNSARLWFYFTVLVFSFAVAVSEQTFVYPPAQGDAKEISFYKAAPANWTAGRVSGQDVRNVIFCIGDGMGTNEIALARQKVVGQGGKLWMERLPIAGLVRTFAANHAVTDSAAAVTAMACGVKTKNGTIGIGTDNKTYASILEVLSKKGWRTGLAATSSITHATPAGFASHVSSRGSEEEIAEQMFNNRVDVLFGGGRKFWLSAGSHGSNLLIAAQRAGYYIVQSREEMMKLTSGPVLGLFADNGMTTFAPEPSLAEMTQKAIALLSAKNKDWFVPEPKFFLMVEGSQIDWAGHANDTDNSIRQTLLFDMAVREAIEFARMDRSTLVIVTADHETGGLLLPEDKNNASKVAADWNFKSHTGADVALFAYGPGAEEFAGVMDNTDIPKKIAKLTGVSPFPQEQPKMKPQISQSAPIK